MKPTSLKSKYVELLSSKSTAGHDLILECLKTYGVYGLYELAEKQLYDFCRVKIIFYLCKIS